MVAPTALVNRFGSMPSDGLKTHLEEAFLAKSVEELATYECVSGHIQPRVMRRIEFFHEWTLTQWVNSVNDKVGVAPAYESIIEHEKTLVNIVPAT